VTGLRLALVLLVVVPTLSVGATAGSAMTLPRASLGPVRATPSITPGVAPYPGHIVTDGTRWAVWRLDESSLRLFDAKTATTTDVPLPPDCVAFGSAVEGVGGGQAALLCQPQTAGVATRHVLLLTLATRSFHAVPGGADPGCNAPSVSRIGARWLVVDCLGGSHETGGITVDWRTGEAPKPTAPAGRREVTSLDTASGKRTLCAPVRRSRLTGEGGILYPIPLGNIVVGNSPSGSDIVVQRCGEARRRTAIRCRVCSVSRGDGWVLVAVSHDAVAFRAARIGKRGLAAPISFMPDVRPPEEYPRIVGKYVLQNRSGTAIAWVLPGARPIK
jgi:hypothetical protein